jgi:SAM-dependent methyltransferase
MIPNPFIKNSPVILQRDIPKDILIKRYKNYLNIDIRSILAATDKISIYKCKESGYRFYFPLDITGDSGFYEKLQENDSYYMAWKWEHQECLRYLKENDNILEVGCGKGDFLKNISTRFKKINCTGLELNKSSVTSNSKYEIINASIEDYSIINEGKFDVVCSFQVLEHISKVSVFLKSNILCLKDGGLLVISVPNNDSYLKYDKFSILNMPPHHMGLWTEESLRKIGEYFNLALVDISYEPLQTYHFDYYTELILRKYFGTYPALIILKIITLLKLRSSIKKYLTKRGDKIRGHSIFIIFKKPKVNSTG